MGIFDREITEEEQLDPWAPTLDPLTQHANMLNNQAPWTSYQGDWVSDMNRTQTGALDNITNYGNREAQWYGQRMQNTGRQFMDNGRNAQNYFNNALNWSAIQNNGPDMEMVAKLADNPYMNGMIDSVGRDVSRNLYENQMPGIAASSAGAGQTGSSRRGAAEAIAARGAADRLADTSATLRGSAYDRALGLGADIASQNADLRYNNRSQGLDAASEIRGMAQDGVGMIESGGDMRRQGYGDALMAGDRLQAQDQSEIDALMAQHMLDQQLPYDQAQAGFNALMDPASEFGERNNKRIEEWDGLPDVITALLTGGGTTINNNNNNTNANSASSNGGNNGGILDRVFGGVGDFIDNTIGDGPGGSTTGVLDRAGGWLGDLIGLGGGGSEQQNESIIRDNQAAVESAGFPAGSPGFMNIMKELIRGRSIEEAINNERGGNNNNSVSEGDATNQEIADLMAQGMTMEQALERLGLSSPDTNSELDINIPGGTMARVPEGTTSTAPVTGNPDDPSLRDLEDYLTSGSMTPEQIQRIMEINAGTSSANSGGNQPSGNQQDGGNANPDLVIPGMAGGNIVDGRYYGVNQNIPDIVTGRSEASNNNPGSSNPANSGSEDRLAEMQRQNRIHDVMGPQARALQADVERYRRSGETTKAENAEKQLREHMESYNKALSSRGQPEYGNEQNGNGASDPRNAHNFAAHNTARETNPHMASHGNPDPQLRVSRYFAEGDVDQGMAMLNSMLNLTAAAASDGAQGVIDNFGIPMTVAEFRAYMGLDAEGNKAE